MPRHLPRAPFTSSISYDQTPIRSSTTSLALTLYTSSVTMDVCQTSRPVVPLFLVKKDSEDELDRLALEDSSRVHLPDL